MDLDIDVRILEFDDVLVIKCSEHTDLVLRNRLLDVIGLRFKVQNLESALLVGLDVRGKVDIGTGSFAEFSFNVVVVEHFNFG